MFFNKTYFSIAVIFFKPFLSRYGCADVVKLLEIHKYSNFIAFGKAINSFRSVLIHTSREVARDAYIKCATRLACKDVDKTH